MTSENMIKVGLPGESLWAEKTGHTLDGRVKAKLMNTSIHSGIRWGQRVVLAEDGYTVAEPESVVRAAEDSVRHMRFAVIADGQP